MNKDTRLVRNPPISFRPDKKTREQIEKLSLAWGCSNTTQVINRCIDWAWMFEELRQASGEKRD